MEIHHKKHHQAYITNFNVARGKLVEAEAKGDVSAMIALQPVGPSLPPSLPPSFYF